MLPSVRSLSLYDQIYLFYDNFLLHKNKLLQNWLKNRNHITVINWPILLPDLNPIKNMWANIGLKLH